MCGKSRGTLDAVGVSRGKVVSDQIRTVDKVRLVKKLGVRPAAVGKKTLGVLRERFGE